MTTCVHQRSVVDQIRTAQCRPLDGICHRCHGAGCSDDNISTIVKRVKGRRKAVSPLVATFELLRERYRHQLVHRAPPQDRDLALVIDMALYYNQHIVPSTTPAQLPFKRNLVPLEYWSMLPLALRHTWIVLVKTRQAFEACTDPVLQPGLCYYRGRSLSLLQEMLVKYQEAIDDPWAATLMSILFVMGADMQLCEEHWTIHLEAARKLICARGGLRTCLQSAHAGPLITYVHADIMTATTCQPWAINPRALKSQFEYLDVQSEVGPQLLEQGHACPVDVLMAITCTNILRVILNRPLTADELPLALHNVTFERARTLLDDFDCHSWAVKTSLAGRSLPQRADEELAKSTLACLTSLAECYKAAALLYLFLSTDTEMVLNNATQEAQLVLSRSLHEIFDKARIDHEGTLDGQLWKFTTWPLFISAYVNAGWYAGNESLDLALDRFVGIAMVLFSTRLMKVPKFLRGVQEKRSMHPDKQWRWDDGFGSRLAFVV